MNKTENHNKTIEKIDIDIKNCKTVCLTLGPYRNLTTLTAATLFLHPNCQVLNHAGDRIFKNKKVNFLSDFTNDKFENFITYATQISEDGERGDHGGSITHAHAFDPKHDMKSRFHKTGQELVKDKINSLFWKESLRTSNYIKQNNIDLYSIIEHEERLRFLMPIRNPLDCAKSNLKTGKAHLFCNLNSTPTIEEVLVEILNEIHWFAVYKEKLPNHFFYYLEHSISQSMLQELADFLKLTSTEEWLSDATSVMVSKSSYTHDQNLIKFYKKLVKKQFSDFPLLQEQLLDFYDQ